MIERKYTWYKLAKSIEDIDFNDEGLAELSVENKRICISKNNQTLQACAAICPHAAQPLVDGYVDVKGNIVCCLHQYKFNLSSGKNVSGEGYFLKTYPIEMRNDGVYIGLY